MDKQQNGICLAPAQQCTGCGTCADVCPVSAIDMTPDEMSFVQPVIRTADCIRGRRGETGCQRSQHLFLNTKPPLKFTAAAIPVTIT